MFMSVRSNYQKISSFVLLFCLYTISASGQAKDIPAHGPAIVLFDGKDLSQSDTFLKRGWPGLRSQPCLHGGKSRRAGNGNRIRLLHHQTGVQELPSARGIQMGRGDLSSAPRPGV